MANGVVALWPYGIRLMSAPKTWMMLEILECSIERVKHALNDQWGIFMIDFIKVTIASVQVLLGLHY